MLNRNKRSVVLDLKRPAAHDALLRLVDGADVFVHNMRLGAAERLGLGYAALSARNPRLVYACASGFRKGSSKQEHPAFDDLIQGMSGMAALNAGPDGAPRYVPSVLVDKLTGQMLASMIGMALFHRERTGQGQEVHVPMLETMLSFLLVEHMWGAVFDQPELGLGYPRMLTPHRRPYATKDGYLSVIAVSDTHWGRLFDAMGRASLIDDLRFATIAARSDNVDALYAVLTEGMRERTTAEWLATLARTRHSVRAGQYARRPAEGRIPARDGILPADAASARRRCDHNRDSGTVLRLASRRFDGYGLLSANIPRKCCARSAATSTTSRRSRATKTAGLPSGCYLNSPTRTLPAMTSGIPFVNSKTLFLIQFAAISLEASASSALSNTRMLISTSGPPSSR